MKGAAKELAILGGILMGIGAGVLMRAGGTMGGTNAIRVR